MNKISKNNKLHICILIFIAIISAIVSYIVTSIIPKQCEQVVVTALNKKNNESFNTAISITGVYYGRRPIQIDVVSSRGWFWNNESYEWYSDDGTNGMPGSISDSFTFQIPVGSDRSVEFSSDNSKGMVLIQYLNNVEVIDCYSESEQSYIYAIPDTPEDTVRVNKRYVHFIFLCIFLLFTLTACVLYVLDIVFETKFKYIWKLMVYLVISSLAFLMSIQFPTSLLRRGDLTFDDAWYRYEGVRLLAGDLPYRDWFSQKGPVLNIIEAIGAAISPWRGVCVLVLISYAVSLIMIYEISFSMTHRKFMSFINVIILMVPYLNYSNEGSGVEIFSLPFILVAMKIFLDYFLYNKISNTRLVVCGLFFAIVFMIRANMISLWIVMCLGVLFKCIKGKEWSNLRQYLIFFVGGALLVFIPLFIWMQKNEIIEGFIKQYFVYNMIAYPTDSSKRLESIIFFCRNPFVIIAFLILIIALVNNCNYITFLFALNFVTSIAFTVVSGYTFGHYGVAIIQGMIFPYCILLNYISNNNLKVNKTTTFIIKKICVVGVLVYLLIFICMPRLISITKTSIYYYTQRDFSHHDQKTLTITQIIRNNTEPEDEVEILIGSLYYLTSGRKHAVRGYQTYSSIFSQNMKDEFFAQLEEAKPKLIVDYYANTTDRQKAEFMETFLQENCYRLITESQTDGYRIWIR